MNAKKVPFILVFALLMLVISTLIIGIPIRNTMIMVVLAFGASAGYVFYLRKKDELQKQVLQEAMANSFLALMVTLLLQGILSLSSDKPEDFSVWAVFLGGLIVFFLNFVLYHLKFWVGNNHEE
ncbi:hypothetical protein I4L69_002337 [Enterococcus faecium]|nr:hypothetical protein [Enterococcus faecium]